jgi:hypothetical protein
VPITDATGSSSWPTPTTQEVEHPDATINQKGRRVSKDGKNSHSLGLADAVRLWPTPTAVTRPMEGNVRLYRAKIEAGEMTEEEATQILGKSPFEAQGKIPAIWRTPTVDDSKNVNPKPNRHGSLVAQVNEAEKSSPATSETGAAGNGGKLNPTWVEWLMGFPPGWTDLEDSETPSSPK